SEIERVLDIRLPAEYREIMLAVSYDYAADYWLAVIQMPDNPKLIIEWNVAFRRDGVVLESWPRHFFIFGQKSCGHPYFLDLKASTTAVFSKSHEGGEAMQVAPNLCAFIEKCLREDEVAEGELDRKTAADPHWARRSPIAIEEAVVNTKKWWQFWKPRV